MLAPEGMPACGQDLARHFPEMRLTRMRKGRRCAGSHPPMVIIAAQDGHKGRLASAWEMCKARAVPVGATPACLINEAPDARRVTQKLAKVELSQRSSMWRNRRDLL